VRKTQSILNQFKTSKSPTEQTSEALNKIILK